MPRTIKKQAGCQRVNDELDRVKGAELRSSRNLGQDPNKDLPILDQSVKDLHRCLETKDEIFSKTF